MQAQIALINSAEKSGKFIEARQKVMEIGRNESTPIGQWSGFFRNRPKDTAAYYNLYRDEKKLFSEIGYESKLKRPGPGSST